jgi:hypothetical protein
MKAQSVPPTCKIVGRNARTKRERLIEQYLSWPTGDGGYPPQFLFVGSDIIVADVDHDGGAELTIVTIDEFASGHDWIFEDDWKPYNER